MRRMRTMAAVVVVGLALSTTAADAQELPPPEATPEQQWTAAVEQVAAEHGVDVATANQRLVDFLVWHQAVSEIAARDGVSIAVADRMLVRFLRSLEAARVAAERAAAAAANPSSVWDRLAECESGGNWSINTGNGYYGGLQFLASTWRANGGTGLPHQHSREEQIRVAENLRATSGYRPWPACSRKLGLR